MVKSPLTNYTKELDLETDPNYVPSDSESDSSSMPDLESDVSSSELEYEEESDVNTMQYMMEMYRDNQRLWTENKAMFEQLLEIKNNNNSLQDKMIDYKEKLRSLLKENGIFRRNYKSLFNVFDQRNILLFVCTFQSIFIYNTLI